MQDVIKKDIVHVSMSPLSTDMALKAICFTWTITLAFGVQIVKRQISGLSRGAPLASLEDPFEPAELSDRVGPPPFMNQQFFSQQNGLLQQSFNQMMQQPNYAANAGGLYNNMFQQAFPGMFNEEIFYPVDIPMQRQNALSRAIEGAPLGPQFPYGRNNNWPNSHRRDSPGNRPLFPGRRSQSAVQEPGLAPSGFQQGAGNSLSLPRLSSRLSQFTKRPVSATAPLSTAGSKQAVYRNQAGRQVIRSNPTPYVSGLAYNVPGTVPHNNIPLATAVQPPLRAGVAPPVSIGFAPSVRVGMAPQVSRWQTSQVPVGWAPPVMAPVPQRTSISNQNSVFQPVKSSPVVSQDRPPAISNILNALNNQAPNKIIPQNVLAKLLADSVKAKGIKQILTSLRAARPSKKQTVFSGRSQTLPQNSGTISSKMSGLPQPVSTFVPLMNNNNPTAQAGVATATRSRPNPTPTRFLTYTQRMRYNTQLPQTSAPVLLGNNQLFQQSASLFPPSPGVSVSNGNRSQGPPINAPVDSPFGTTISINTPDPKKSSVLVVPADKIGTVAAPL